MDVRNRKGRIVSLAALFLAAALVLPCLNPAWAETAPSGALLAPPTVKPWLVHADTTSPAQPAAETPTATRPPSSLNELEADIAGAPAPSPTATETPNGLPGVLALDDSRRLRVLLIGTDAYHVDDPGRSDTMILLQVDIETGDIRMVSFLRDLYVSIPGHGKTRLNAAYVYGGAKLLKQTLQNNFGVTVDRTVAVNFSLMVTLVDRIGGVTVDVSERERVQLNSILKFYNTQNGYNERDQLLAQSGTQNLTGKQALCYSRIRKIDSDFQRVGRQRKVLEAVYARLRGMDALTLTNILADCITDVRTDLTTADAVALIPVLLNLDDVTFSGLTVPVSNGYGSETRNGMSVLVPNLDRNREAVDRFLYQ